MTLEEEIADTFQKNEWTWNVKGGTMVPDADDVQAALDRAAEILHNEPLDTQLEVGRLHIVKTVEGYDVFILVGHYM